MKDVEDVSWAEPAAEKDPQEGKAKRGWWVGGAKA